MCLELQDSESKQVLRSYFYSHPAANGYQLYKHRGTEIQRADHVKDFGVILDPPINFHVTCGLYNGKGLHNQGIYIKVIQSKQSVDAGNGKQRGAGK